MIGAVLSVVLPLADVCLLRGVGVLGESGALVVPLRKRENGGRRREYEKRNAGCYAEPAVTWLL